MTITRDPGELFIQGHTGSANQATAWVERGDPESLEPVRRSPDLDGGPIWPGGIAAHRNGYLYVTFGRWCHRLNLDCGLVCSRILPRERPYNSLLILPDGHLVMKDFAGGRGVDALPPGVRGSELIVLEPEKLEIVARYELPEGSIARLSADLAPDGAARVYVIGETKAMRLLWDTVHTQLSLDEPWTTEYMAFAGQTFGWDAVIEDGYAWFLDNGEGTRAFGPSFRGKGASSAPLHLVRVPLDAGIERPAAAYLEVCGEPNGIVANPPLIDVGRHIAVGYDSGNGVVTAWSYSSPHEPSWLWQRDQNQAGHMILFPESGELICYDYDQDAGTEQCLVVDVQTGREKARVAIGSPVQCVVFPAAGWHRDFYITTFTTIARVYVQ